MLQTIRDKTHGWIAGVIISLLILSFALWGIHSYLEGGANTSVIAKVNGVEITKNQLANAYDRMQRQMQNQNNNEPLPKNAEAKLKQQALESLINTQVLTQASMKEGYRISMNQVDALLENMPEFQVNGRFSPAKLQQVLLTTQFNLRDFLDLIRTSLLIDQPRLGMLFTSFALPDEVANTMALISQERQIQYAVLSLDYFAKQPITIPAEKITAYYDQHVNDFKTPEQVSVAYIQLSEKELLSDIAVSEQAIKDFYNQNTNAFTQPAKIKIESILLPVPDNATSDVITNEEIKADRIAQRGKGNADLFAEAKKLNATRADDALQGWIEVSKLPLEWQKTVAGLTASGQVTTPLKAKNGLVIIKVVELKPAETQTFEQAKNKIKETLARQQVQEKMSALKDKLASVSYEHPDSLEPAAKAVNLPIRTTAVFTRDQGHDELSQNTKLRDVAFSEDVLNLQNNSDVIQLTPDTYIVLRVSTHTPASQLELKKVEKEIVAKLVAEEVATKTEQLANELKTKLQQGVAMSEIAKEYHLTWSAPAFVMRRANQVDSGVLNVAFALPKDKKVSYGIAKVSTGYALVALLGVRADSSEDAKKNQQVFGEQIQNAQGMLEYELYQQSLIKRAKVKMM